MTALNREIWMRALYQVKFQEYKLLGWEVDETGSELRTVMVFSGPISGLDSSMSATREFSVNLQLN